MTDVHMLDSFTGRCICNDFSCKEWKKQFINPGEEKRCKRCWSVLTWHEDEIGNITLWCLNCSSANVP
jgi:hypothetical protein